MPGMIGTLAGDFELHDEITIGAVPTTMTGLIPRTVKALRDIHAGLHIRIVPGLSSELLPQVDRGFLDAAILSWPANLYGHLNWSVFAEEELIVIAPPDAIEDDACALLGAKPPVHPLQPARLGRPADRGVARGSQDSCAREHGAGYARIDRPDGALRAGRFHRPAALRAATAYAYTQARLAPSTVCASTSRLAVAPGRSEKARLIDIVLAELGRQVQLGRADEP